MISTGVSTHTRYMPTMWDQVQAALLMVPASNSATATGIPWIQRRHNLKMAFTVPEDPTNTQPASLRWALTCSWAS